MVVSEEISAAVVRKDWNAVADLIQREWNDLMRGDRVFLHSVLDSLPSSALEQFPRLAAARDYVNFLPPRHDARPLRYRHETAEPQHWMDQLAVLTGRSAASRVAGRFADAVAEARAGLGAVDVLPTEAVLQLRPVIAELRLQWAISLLLGGHLTEALHQYAEAFDEAVRQSNTRVAIEAAGTIAFTHALAGNITDAEPWLQRMPDASVSSTDSVHALGCFARALIAAARLDADGARAALDDAPAADLTPETWALRVFVESRVAALFGDPRAQLTSMLAQKAAHPEASWATGFNAWVLWVAEMELVLAVGDSARARTLITSLPTLASGERYDLPAVLRAWFQVRYGDMNQASAVIASLLVDQPSADVTANALAISALANHQLAQPEAAGRLFASCLTIVTQQGLYEIVLRLSTDELRALDPGLTSLDPVARERIATYGHVRESRKPLTVLLSARERVVLRHLVEGMTVLEIASAEHVSRNTVKTQLRSLYRKLGADDRRSAVDLATAHPELWG